MRFLLIAYCWVFYTACAFAQPEWEFGMESVRELIRRDRVDSALYKVNTILESGAGSTNQRSRAYHLQGICWYKKRLPGEALVSFQRALSQYELEPDTTLPDAFRATLYFHIGDVFGGLAAPDSSRFYLERSMLLRAQLFGEDSPTVGFCLNSLGGLEAGRYRLGRAMDYRLRSLEIFEKNRLYRHAFAVAGNLALQCMSIGDDGKAMLFMEKSEEFWKKEASSSTYRAIMLSNYAVLLARTQQARDAYARIALAWAAQAESEDSTAWLDLSENHAELLRLLNEPVEATRMDSLRLQRLRICRPDGIGAIANVHAALANDYFLAGNANESLLHWDAAINLYQKVFTAQQPTLADAFRGKAMCLAALGDTAQAFFFLDQSLVANGFDAQKTDSIIQWDIGFESFLERARLHYFSGQRYAALADISRADSCVILQRLLLQVSSSKGRLAARSRPAYELGAEIAAQCYEQTRDPQYLRLAFHFSEQCKSIELAEVLRTFYDRPEQADSTNRRLFELEEIYRAEIYRARDALKNAGNAGGASSPAKLPAAHFQYLALLDTIRTVYPKYYNHKFGRHTIDPDSLSAWCAAHDRTVVSWFLTDQSILAFVFPKGQKPGLRIIPRDFDIEQAVEQMNVSITDLFAPAGRSNLQFRANYPKYLAAARILYDTLMLPLKLEPGGKIMMVPDGVLYHLSFDALLSDSPADPYKFQKLQFAAQQFQFSYAFSATLLAEPKRREQSPEGKCRAIAFAPFAYPEDDLTDTGLGLESPLALSEKLSTTAMDTFKGCPPLLRTQATIDRFLSLAPAADFIHISTHGISSQANAAGTYLLFADPKAPRKARRLSADSISHLSLHARLVVLSACSSGQGPVIPGEGMLSIARAFVYAGAQTVLMAHWNVNETESNLLIQNFYKYLSSGMKPDDALWKAKNEYLLENLGAGRMPYLWAGFSIIGASE